jgi:hypothetical protein
MRPKLMLAVLASAGVALAATQAHAATISLQSGADLCARHLQFLIYNPQNGASNCSFCEKVGSQTVCTAVACDSTACSVASARQTAPPSGVIAPPPTVIAPPPPPRVTTPPRKG